MHTLSKYKTYADNHLKSASASKRNSYKKSQKSNKSRQKYLKPHPGHHKTTKDLLTNLNLAKTQTEVLARKRLLLSKYSTLILFMNRTARSICESIHWGSIENGA